jgi:two-component system chemotaxis response regulator CheB
MVLKRLGGIAIVQDPETAIFPGMPTHALEHVDADYVLPVETMPKVLERLAHDVTPPAPAPVAGGESTSSVPHTTPQPVGFTCPECGGTLFELREGNLVRYQCRVGHAYSPGSMLSEKSRAVDAALWTALNALEERAELLKRMAEAAQARNHRITAERFAQHAASTAAQANTLRELLLPEHASELMDRIVDRAAHPEER